ncbi:MAG TPA: hypothetical protein VM661_03800 [Candidatus Sulfotelmatobacter sp.]|nr:hypothetical protein [Candidatus Sulfotelmatobacter sp.]
MTKIRQGCEGGRTFILSFSPRLAAVADLPWRPADEVARFQVRFMETCLAVPGSVSFVAED